MVSYNITVEEVNANERYYTSIQTDATIDEVGRAASRLMKPSEAVYAPEETRDWDFNALMPLIGNVVDLFNATSAFVDAVESGEDIALAHREAIAAMQLNNVSTIAWHEVEQALQGLHVALTGRYFDHDA